MVTVKVLFDYAATQEDELTLTEGDIVENVSQPEGGWWSGTLHGKTGVFPDNFVEVIPTKAKPPSKPPPPKQAAPPAAAAPAPAPAAAAPAPAKPAGPKKKKAKCVFDYDPVQEDELLLKVGDIVVIVKEDVADGWHEGELNGKQGVFPSNFVEMLSDDHADPPPPAAAAPLAAEAEEPQQKKPQVHGVGFGNIFQGGMPQLKKTVVPPPVANKERPETTTFVAPQLRQTIKRPPTTSAPTTAGAPPPIPASSKPADTRPQYRALFDYTAANEDELSLKPGQLLRIVKKEEGGWWQGDLEGKVGWFPDNFVEPVPEDEKKEEKKEEPAPAPVEKRAILPPGKSAPPPLPGGKPKAEEPPPPLPSKPKEEAAPPPIPAKKEEPPAPAPAPLPKAVFTPPPSEPALPRTASTAKAVPELPAKPGKPAAPPAKPKPPVKNADEGEHKDEPAAGAAAPPTPLERTLSNSVAQLKKVDSSIAAAGSAFGAKGDSSKDTSASAGSSATALTGAGAGAGAGASNAATEAKVAELTDQVKTMREEMDKMKKQVSMLITELDEEKAARSKMQIDIDRIRKLMQ